MSNAILTIIIPTYNRSAHLAVLLDALRRELDGLESLVRVLVSDNASTDATSEVTSAVARAWPVLNVQRHDRNLGPDGNFLSCFPKISTRYFWIIGDDDCPKRGVLAQITRILMERTPALLYMQSEWVNQLRGPDQGETIGTLSVYDLSARKFAEAVHVWVTYISGMVINKERLFSVLGDQLINRFDQTSLAQLGWVLPLLKSNGPFLFISDRCILATKDNSGGYPMLTVFGVNFTRIVNESFGAGHPLARALISGNITQNLPYLIWATRNTHQPTAYTTENPWMELNKQLGTSWMYWLLLVPMGRFPRWLALPFFQVWKIQRKLLCKWNERSDAH